MSSGCEIVKKQMVDKFRVSLKTFLLPYLKGRPKRKTGF